MRFLLEWSFYLIIYPFQVGKIVNWLGLFVFLIHGKKEIQALNQNLFLPRKVQGGVF